MFYLNSIGLRFKPEPVDKQSACGGKAAAEPGRG